MSVWNKVSAISEETEIFEIAIIVRSWRSCRPRKKKTRRNRNEFWGFLGYFKWYGLKVFNRNGFEKNLKQKTLSLCTNIKITFFLSKEFAVQTGKLELHRPLHASPPAIRQLAEYFTCGRSVDNSSANVLTFGLFDHVTHPEFHAGQNAKDGQQVQFAAKPFQHEDAYVIIICDFRHPDFTHVPGHEWCIHL